MNIYNKLILLKRKGCIYMTKLFEHHNMMLKPDEGRDKLLRLKHISHLDLDGYGATILSEFITSLYPEGSIDIEVVNINPNKLYNEVVTSLEIHENYDMIIITDLAINQNIVDYVNEHPHGDKILVFDHHRCDIENVPENFIIMDKSPVDNSKLTCATELYYRFISNDDIFSIIKNEDTLEAIKYFVECVRVYDTFEFWSTRNDPVDSLPLGYFDAPRLNILFHIMERDEFKQYIVDYFRFINWKFLTTNSLKGDADDLFKATSTIMYKYMWIPKVLELEQNKNNKYVESAIRRMVRLPFKYDIYRKGRIHYFDYNIGVIFAEKSSPVIANTCLERNDDIDFCAVISNNQVSIYTNTARPHVDVSAIANVFGGGGHKEAAGFTIPYIDASVFNINHFGKIMMCAGYLSADHAEFDDIDIVNAISPHKDYDIFAYNDITDTN